MQSRSRSWRPVVAVVCALLVGGVVAALLDAGSAPQPTGPSLVPRANEPIPRSPGPLARELTRNTSELRAAIERWRGTADPSSGRPPGDVTLRALYHQRIHILLSERPRLARRTIGHLRASIASEARDLVAARRALARLSPPVRPERFRTGRALPAGVLLRYYRKAQRRFGVSWRVLAAVNLVETAFNRLRSQSVAGAQGPMQFLPSTWLVYGLGGDIDDPQDAIMGAANYLRASGAPGNYGRALYAYNPARLYVDAVLRYARRIRRDSRTYYVLYNWQVFVRTPTGLRRLTGPSSD